MLISEALITALSNVITKGSGNTDIINSLLRLDCYDDPQIAQQILDDYAEIKGWEIYED